MRFWIALQAVQGKDTHARFMSDCHAQPCCSLLRSHPVSSVKRFAFNPCSKAAWVRVLVGEQQTSMQVGAGVSPPEEEEDPLLAAGVSLPEEEEDPLLGVL